MRSVRSWWTNLEPLSRLAVQVWVVITLLAVGRAALFYHPRHQGCYQTYSGAGQAWVASHDLYTPRPGLDVYRYSPLVAVMLTPIGAMPGMLGSAVLRAVNLVVFLGGLVWWSRSAAPIALSARHRAALLLLAAPLAARSLADLQVNGLTIGLLVVAMAAIAREKWNSGALLVVLACMIKMYAISLALLLVVLYPRRFLGRFGLALLACLALPFALQSPAYVLRQYDLWVRWGLNNRPNADFQDLRLLLGVFSLHPSELTYLAIQLGVAAAVALFCLWERLVQVPFRRLLCVVFGLSCCWMMVLGPATEFCTYIFIAPIVAWVVLEAWLEGGSWQRRVVPGAAFAMYVGCQVALWFRFGSALGHFAPYTTATLLIMGWIVVQELRRSRIADQLALGPSPPLPLPSEIAVS